MFQQCIFTLVVKISIFQKNILLYLTIIYKINMFALSDRAISSRRKTLMNINVNSLSLRLIILIK